MTVMEKTVQTLEQLSDLAEDVLRVLPVYDTRATLVALTGDLGAGKTAFTKALARALGVEEEVVSPTFSILKRYPLHEGASFRTLAHLDMYRIDQENELRPIGFPSLLLEARTLVVVEWPEKVPGALGEEKTTVHITHRAGGERVFRIDFEQP